MKTCTRRFDVAGMEVGRITRRVLMGKITPYWSCAEGLHLSKLMTLTLRHWFGRPIAWLTLRYEPYWLRLLSLWRRLRARPDRTDNPSETATDN
jgi:hypothetical protein